MKKTLLTLGLLAGLNSAAQAQETRFGIKAGVSLSNATGDGTDDLKNLVGANGGVMADFGFSDLLSFHPELLFSQKGAKTESTDPFGSGGKLEAQTRLNYVDLPLLLRLKTGGIFFEAGPQLGFLASRNSEATVTYPGQPSSTTSNSNTKGVRSVDLGYLVGVGYQLPQGLELGVRYNGGFLDLSDPSNSVKNYNSVFQFQVGYLFGGQ